MLVFAVIPHVIMKYIEQKGDKKFNIKDLFFYVLKQPKLILGTCLVPLGLFIYMLFLHLRAGDGLAFVHIQKAWGIEREGIFTKLYNALKNIQGYSFYLSLWAIWGIISVYHFFKNKRYDEAVLNLIFVFIPLSVRIASIPRYLIGSFLPVVAMCDMLEKKNKVEIGAFLILAVVMSGILYRDWLIVAPYLT